MPDEIDRSVEYQEKVLDIQLRLRKPSGPAACGYCHNCGDEVSEDKRWCDSACRNDWENRKSRGLD